MAAQRGVKFFNAKNHSLQLNKIKAAEKICKEYKCNLQETAYVGDDYYDLGLLNEVGFAFAPSDAVTIIQKNPRIVKLNRKGGEGVLEALYEYSVEKLNVKQRYPYENS
jgi:3-deoxy-D-manno-octulosonate 8-phosphate phosphatase (KDO 8-P phosphatase)